MYKVDLTKPEEVMFYLILEQKRADSNYEMSESSLIKEIIEECIVVEQKTKYWGVVYGVAILLLTAFAVVSAFDFTPVIEDAIRGKCEYNPPSDLLDKALIIGAAVSFWSVFLVGVLMKNVITHNLFAHKLKEFSKMKLSWI